MSVRTTETNYLGDDAELTQERCATCKQRLNETEVEESEYHTSGRMLCTKHLHEELGIPE